MKAMETIPDLIEEAKLRTIERLPARLMDEYSRKRAVNGIAAPRKGAGLILRETSNSREHNAQICSRIGCSSKHNSTKGTQIVSDKAKFSRPSFRTLSSGKEIIGSSSKASAVVSGARKSSLNPPKKLSSHLETDTSESGAALNEPEVTEVVSSAGKAQRELNTESQGPSSVETAVTEVGSSSTMSNTRSRRNIHQRSGLSNQDSLISSSSQHLASRTTSQPVRANGSKYGLKNLKCNSISDVVASGCSSSDSSKNMRKDAVKKRNSDGESSSSTGGKKMAMSSLERRSSGYNHNAASVSESRRARNWPQIRDSAVASVRTRRPGSSYGRTRLPNQGNGDTNSLSSQESSAVSPQVPQSEESIDFSTLSAAVAELSHAGSFNRLANRSLDITILGSSDFYSYRNQILRTYEELDTRSFDHITILGSSDFYSYRNQR